MRKFLQRTLALFSMLAFCVGGIMPASAAATNMFRRPLNNVLDPAISAHYDDDTRAGKAKNYFCGTSTVYDNHRGTDFRAAVGTTVYAAKDGILYYRYDSCPTYGYQGSTCGGGYGNHVRIDHESPFTDGQGLISIYAHLKQSSPAAIGAVTCGTMIGLSGSSGNSTGPHLHFEMRKYGYPNDDPFSGACGGSMSFWVDQAKGLPAAVCQ